MDSKKTAGCRQGHLNYFQPEGDILTYRMASFSPNTALIANYVDIITANPKVLHMVGLVLVLATFQESSN